MNKPVDPSKLTATPVKRASDTLPALPSNLRAAVPALKAAPKLPATSKHQWRDFDDFTHCAEVLVWRYDEKLGGKWWKWCEDSTLAMIAEFNAGLEFFNREDFYQRTKVAKRDLLNRHTHRQLTRRVVSEQVGLLIGSFPNGVPNSPEVYTRMLIEEIFAANPSAVALEATCREIRRTKTFVPAVAEVLKVLKERAEWWKDADETVDCMEDDHAARQEKKRKGEANKPELEPAP